MPVILHQSHEILFQPHQIVIGGYQFGTVTARIRFKIFGRKRQVGIFSQNIKVRICSCIEQTRPIRRLMFLGIVIPVDLARCKMNLHGWRNSIVGCVIENVHQSFVFHLEFVHPFRKRIKRSIAVTVSVGLIQILYFDAECVAVGFPDKNNQIFTL